MNLNVASSQLRRGLQEGWLTVPKLCINGKGASTCDCHFPLMHSLHGLQEGWLTVPKLRINGKEASTCDGPFPLMHNLGYTCYIEPNILWNPTLKCQFQMKVTVSFGSMKRYIPVMPLLVTCGGGALFTSDAHFGGILAPIISEVTILWN